MHKDDADEAVDRSLYRKGREVADRRLDKQVRKDNAYEAGDHSLYRAGREVAGHRLDKQVRKDDAHEAGPPLKPQWLSKLLDTASTSKRAKMTP